MTPAPLQATLYAGLSHARMGVWEALELLGSLREYETPLLEEPGTDADLALPEHAAADGRGLPRGVPRPRLAAPRRPHPLPGQAARAPAVRQSTGNAISAQHAVCRQGRSCGIACHPFCRSQNSYVIASARQGVRC